jgi:hypothetical protein
MAFRPSAPAVPLLPAPAQRVRRQEGGVEVWLLIHFEMQGKKEQAFPERMFIYAYRIYDRYRRPVISLAILCDDDPQWRPTTTRVREQADAHLYHSLIGEARAIRQARGSGYRAAAWSRLEQALRLQTPEKDLAELRHEAGACLGDFVGLEPTTWGSPAGTYFGAFDLHPDGDLLAVVLSTQTRSGVLIRNVVTGQEVARLGAQPALFYCVKFSAPP